MTEKTFLQLVGAETYNSAATGVIRKGDIVPVETEGNEDLIDELLEKGEIVDEDYTKPLFKEVDDPDTQVRRRSAKPAAPTSAKSVRAAGSGDLSLADLDKSTPGAGKPQNPVGNGPNGAETTQEEIDEQEAEDEAEEEAAKKPLIQPSPDEPVSPEVASGKVDHLGEESEGQLNLEEEEESSEEETEEEETEEQEETTDEAEETPAKPVAKRAQRAPKPKAVKAK